MSHGRKALIRAVAPAAVLALALTGCGSDDSSDSKAEGKTDGKKSSSEKTEQGGAEEEAPAGPLKLGQTAPGQHKYDMSDGKAKLEITAKTVKTGANKDLLAAGLKGEDVKGMQPVFVTFQYTVKEGSKLDDPGFNRKVRVLGEDKKPGKSLIAIGADPIPGGCPDVDEVKWKAGDTKTLCSTFLLPEGTAAEQVAWAGDLRDPLIWNVK
ncbi:hypothetical protein [Streptomyces iconiensis]|uniref:Lipoprotein n=1 Tax=Streptomyces iconiensis TaxID=1384038 RepID=A0ABT6ZRA2_9ACTN|nr:hypothetical protein [Streptomyces iconiensis]MDJ1131564.1 hypothetical protein [Streptomyces iconiensis]